MKELTYNTSKSSFHLYKKHGIHLHVIGEMSCVFPVLGEVVELVRVDDAENQHGVDDCHPPEDVDRQTPPPVTQLQCNIPTLYVSMATQPERPPDSMQLDKNAVFA